jgi:hypothetical protein
VTFNDPQGEFVCTVGGIVACDGWTDFLSLLLAGYPQQHQQPAPLDPPTLTGRQILARAEHLARKWLANSKDCQKLYNLSGNGIDPQQALSSLIASGSYTNGLAEIRLFTLPFPTTGFGGFTYPNVTTTSVGGGPPLVTAIGADIVINTNINNSD